MLAITEDVILSVHNVVVLFSTGPVARGHDKVVASWGRTDSEDHSKSSELREGFAFFCSQKVNSLVSH